MLSNKLVENPFYCIKAIKNCNKILRKGSLNK